MEPPAKRAKQADSDGNAETNAIAFVCKNRGRALTVEERLDILAVSANLRSGAAKLRTKEPIDVKVGRLLARSSKTVHDTWSTFEKLGTIIVVKPPANRSDRPTRVLAVAELQSTVRAFIQKRCETRTRTVARDVLLHLVETDLIGVDADDPASWTSALRAVQRFVKRAGYGRGKAKGMYRISADHQFKRDEYIKTMLSVDAHEYRDVYLDESYIHVNYARHDDSLYDPANPNMPKAKHKGQRYCFIAAIVDKDRSRPDAAEPGADIDAADDRAVDTSQAFLIEETIDIFQGGKQTKDYHGMFDHKYFSDWMDKLLAALEAHGLNRCRIIMDNAKYHKVMPDCVPRKSDKKEVLLKACDNFGIKVSPSAFKSELWKALDAHVKENVEPVIVEKAKHAGHVVVITPPFFSYLQPIEYVWAIVKGEVGRQYTAETKFAEIKPRLDCAFANVKSRTVQGCIDKARARLHELHDHVMVTEDMSDSDSDEHCSSESGDSDLE